MSEAAVKPAPAVSLAGALRLACDTRAVEFGENVLARTPRLFRDLFGTRPAVIVADANTFAAAGAAVLEALRAGNVPVVEPFIFRTPDLYAEHRFVEELQAALGRQEAIPIAVGSGTINDLTKLAAHRLGRRYLCVATAASMDGYAAFGASITWRGSKQTFSCPAPLGLVVDLNVLAGAPAPMRSWGYADMLAKITAGADWILADALGVEPIQEAAWAMAQGRLRDLLSDPAGVRAGRLDALGRLAEGLVLGGLAMQAARSSRPASGAEHQFSHLWDMQHHTHQGRAPSHGFKVGIGTLAVAALYEWLLAQPLERLDVEACVACWPEESDWRRQVRETFGEGELASVAEQEVLAKHCERAALRAQLLRLRELWPALRARLSRQLLGFDALREMLAAAGAPTEPEQIGISRERLRAAYLQAVLIRRRFTVLDVVVRTGTIERALDAVFGPGGRWPVDRASVGGPTGCCFSEAG